MAENAGSSTGGDQGPKEHQQQQLSLQQPTGTGDVEMDDLSSNLSNNTQPKLANPDGPTSTVSPSEPSPVSPQTDDADPGVAPTIPSPITEADASSPTGAEASNTAKTQAKAPENTDDLTIDPVEPADSTDPADGGDTMAVEIMLLLTTVARHPFRIDEKYLTKRNVTVTGKTADGKMDPSSITVYTLKELILRDWRKEWDQPPREPSAIRLIHFGRMLEDRMPLNRE